MMVAKVLPQLRIRLHRYAQRTHTNPRGQYEYSGMDSPWSNGFMWHGCGALGNDSYRHVEKRRDDEYGGDGFFLSVRAEAPL